MAVIFPQYDGGDEGPGQVGGDGQDRCFLCRRGPHGAGHDAGGQQLPGSGIHWNLPWWVSKQVYNIKRCNPLIRYVLA